MPKELFPNPTVKHVIFQIRYPNLFYLESKMGDFQLTIIEQFPDSSLIIRKPLLLADLGSESKLESLSEKIGENEGASKIWRFSSPKNYNLNVMNDSLDISSNYHKTYDNKGSDIRFRDIIEFVSRNFLEIMKVPLITRIGLRYIDECPLPVKNNETYNEYYNSAFNTSKFSLDEAREMDYKTVVSRGKYSLRYGEMLKKEGDNFKVILDFDAFANSVKPSDYLSVTDALHKIIIKEFLGTVNQPILEIMRKK